MKSDVPSSSSISLSKEDRAFGYQLFKRIVLNVRCTKVQRKMMKRIVLKFTPGERKLIFPESDRQLVLALITKILRAMTMRPRLNRGHEYEVLERIRIAFAATEDDDGVHHADTRELEI
jgi:hypothetical protein